MDHFGFLPLSDVDSLRARFGTPFYLYDGATLRSQAESALRFPQAFGLTVRFAVKAAPNRTILRHFGSMGLHFDASSGYEVERLVLAGIDPARISLSTQEMPEDFGRWVARGLRFNACSLSQLDRFGQAFPGAEVGVRFNPGMGSGGTNRTNTGGPASSFGIWHGAEDAIRATLDRHRLQLVRVHTHIGSGSDPEVWQRVALLNLGVVRRFPSVTTLNMGGGFKVARMPEETATDLELCGAPVRQAIRDLETETGRRIHLEIEPGTFLTANAGILVSTIQDLAETGPEGYSFLKLDCGMTEILRPSLYGAQHPIAIVPAPGPSRVDSVAQRPFVVVGHCCESGDILTPAKGQPEVIASRHLHPSPRRGDACLIGGAGAYCSAMAAGNYNSFPLAPEVWRDEEGSYHLIRRRQSLSQIVANECWE